MSEEGKGYWDMTPDERTEQVIASGGGFPSFIPPRGDEPRFALSSQGPVQFNTETGFQAMADQPPGQLTAEEIAEFRALRAEKKKRDAEAAAEAEAAALRLQEPTHHVHLADGTIVKGSAIETHYDNGAGLVTVASAHEIKPVLIAG